MKEFFSYISEKWGVRPQIVKEIRESFEKGDSPNFAADYLPSVCAEIELAQLWEIHDFLAEAEALVGKKFNISEDELKETFIAAVHSTAKAEAL